MQKFNDEYKRAPYSTPEILTLMYNKKRNRFSNQNISLDCFTAGVRLTDIDQLNFEIRKFASKTNLRRAEKNNYACHIVIWLIQQILFFIAFMVNCFYVTKVMYAGLIQPVPLQLMVLNSFQFRKLYHMNQLKLHKNRVQLIKQVINKFNEENDDLGVKFSVSKYGSYMQILVLEPSLIPEVVTKKYRNSSDSIEDLRLQKEAQQNEGLIAPIGYQNPHWNGYTKTISKGVVCVSESKAESNDMNYLQGRKVSFTNQENSTIPTDNERKYSDFEQLHSSMKTNTRNNARYYSFSVFD